jgi:hypothetical protein
MTNRQIRGSLSAMPLFSVFILLLLPGCGEGWDGYKHYYDTIPGGDVGEAWTGPESVYVVHENQTVETFLAGIITAGYSTSSGLVLAAVRLSDLVEAAGITTEPASFRYDFTASDGYNLLTKRDNDLMKLPDWDTMHYGYLYVSDIGDLRVGWDEDKQPWGGAVSAYNVKYMDGGTIELLEP